MSDLHHKELSRFVIKLVNECNWRGVSTSFWYQIEQILWKSLHLLNTTELLTIRYALTMKTPKLGSLDLRKQIDKLIEDEFKTISLDDFILYMMCQVNTPCLQKFEKIKETLRKRANEIKAVAKEGRPDILANFFYAYCISRPKHHKRAKTRGAEPNMELEASQILDLFFDQLSADFSKLSTAAVYRLAFALEQSSLKDVRELYWR